MFRLIVEPKTSPMKMSAFLKYAPSNSIAIDGFVNAAPGYIVKRGKDGARYPYANIDHHVGVTRQETRASCGQALINLRSGMIKAFTAPNGEVVMNVYVNDCDADVCLTTFLLANYKMVARHMPRRLSQLVYMEDLLDATAGAYDFPDHLIKPEVLAWIFEPYDAFRIAGGLDRKISSEYQSVIDAVHMRIQMFIDRKEGSIDLDLRYKILADHKDWVLVEETGRNARLGMFRDGIDAFVSVHRRPDGRYRDVIGRRSMFIDTFPVLLIGDRLNIAERCVGDLWGGAPTVIGSPRVNGTGQDPDQVTEIVNGSIRSYKINSY